MNDHRKGFIEIPLFALAVLIGLGLIVYPAHKKQAERITHLQEELAKPHPLTFQSNGLLGVSSGSGQFPTSTLNNFQDGDTINSGDWNALERKIGIDRSSDTTSLDWMLRAPTSTDPGHVHSINVATGTITTLQGTTFAATTITATTSITIAGKTAATVTTSSITWTVANESGVQDDIIWIAPVAGTITSIVAVNKSSGTVPFNLGWDASASTGTSTIKKAFTAFQTISATTTPTTVTINGSSTFSVGDVFRYFTTSAASSTEFHFTVGYRANP